MKRDVEILTRCVAELEARTSAEVVVVLKRSSGNYRDVDALCGAATAFTLLLFLLFTPTVIHPLSLPLPLLLAFIAGLLGSRKTGLRRLLTRSSRRARQVRDEANATFIRHNLHTTRHRTGLLLFYSHLERSAVILADIGANEAFPPEARERFRQQLERVARRRLHWGPRIGGFLRTLGVHLERVLPVEEKDGEDTNELPDTVLLHDEDETS